MSGNRLWLVCISLGCTGTPPDTDTETESDTDTDTDTDSDTDADADTDSPVYQAFPSVVDDFTSPAAEVFEGNWEMRAEHAPFRIAAPFEVTGDLRIEPGVVVVVEAAAFVSSAVQTVAVGGTVDFGAGSILECQGPYHDFTADTLVVAGTASSPVVLGTGSSEPPLHGCRFTVSVAQVEWLEARNLDLRVGARNHPGGEGYLRHSTLFSAANPLEIDWYAANAPGGWDVIERNAIGVGRFDLSGRVRFERNDTDDLYTLGLSGCDGGASPVTEVTNNILDFRFDGQLAASASCGPVDVTANHFPSGVPIVNQVGAPGSWGGPITYEPSLATPPSPVGP